MSAELTAPDALAALAAQALAHARDGGASAAEVVVSQGTALSVQVRQREVDTLTHHQSRHFGITVYLNDRQGQASSSDWSAAAIDETVRAACAIARHAAPDPHVGLAEADCLATEFPDYDLDHPWALTPEQAIDLALGMEAAALESDPRIVNSQGAGVGSQRNRRHYANTLGFAATRTGTRHHLSCTVLAREGDGVAQRDSWYSMARCADDLQPAQAVGLEAARRALAKIGARPVPTARVPVLFAAEAARTLIGHLLSAIKGSAQYRRTSFLAGAQGERIAAAALRVEDDPTWLRGLASGAYDREGVATQRRMLVDNGVLQGYLLDSYAARRLGLRTTGNAGGAHNVRVVPGSAGFDELLRELGRGLVVTHLLGQGVNLTTGDYSRGAGGFWVEGGVIAHPVEEITIAGHLRDMLTHIVAIGADVDTRGSVHCPSMIVEGMTLAGR